MPKQSLIKWRDVDKKRLAKNLGRFNAKLTRLAKKDASLASYLPKRLNTNDIKSSIKTRADFNKQMKSIERFMRPDATKKVDSKTGIKITQWEKKEISLKVKAINIQRKKELERANPSTEKGTMGSVSAQNLAPKKFDIDKIKKSDWDKFVESVEKQASSDYLDKKIKCYKQNYLDAINNFLGESGKELYEYVSKLDAKFIYENYYEDPLLQIGFTSDPLPVDTIAESALERWKEVSA